MHNSTVKRLIFLAGMSVVLIGCSTSNNYNPPGNVDSLQGLQQMNSAYSGSALGSNSNANINDIRYAAVKETALSVGARAALAWRSNQVNAILTEDSTILDQAFNFYGLMLPDNVLPPVLQEARNILNLAGPDTIRLASQIFLIKSQARFVTAPPTWRDYLWMNYPAPDRPDNSLLPKNAAEQGVWNHYVTVGWDSGFVQANNIFLANLARLNSDYKGMVLYRELYEQNMVSAPFVAKVDLGITGDGSQMSINDQVLRITALPQLNLDGNTWKPVLIPDPLAAYKLNLMRQVSPKSIPSNMKANLYIK